MNIKQQAHNILETRTISSFGISIGTGLALEALFNVTTERYDDNRVIPDKVRVDDYTIHYFNIFTIARNIISALTVKNSVDMLYASNQLMQTLVEEVNTIHSLYDMSNCKPVLYIPDYKSLYKDINLGKTGDVVTKDYFTREYVLNNLKVASDHITMTVEHGNKHKLKPNTNKVLITTHLSVDLLNISKIKNLYLLESHTGKLKSYREWYSKLHKIGKLSLEVFPFIEEIVYILGDGGISLMMKLHIRRELHRLAMEKRWTSYTSKVVVIQHIRNDSILKDVLNNFKRSY